MDKIKVMSVFGTRPEAIKMCPLIKEMQSDKRFQSIVCVTAQHREMLDSVLSIFKVVPDFDLDIMQKKQTLSQITTRIIDGMEEILLDAAPDIVLVHGDTTTSFAVALAAFYQKIPVGHVEAGLRTYNRYSPYPEEMNRMLTSRLASIHFAPTELTRDNLARENVTKNVFVTGNTVLDAIKTTVCENYEFHDQSLKSIDFSKRKTILLTAHRRENLGMPLDAICRAVKRIAALDDVRIIYPVHPNPAVLKPVTAALSGIPHVHLLEPLDVCDLHNLMSKSFLVMTDSGGLQEEAPSFKKPVLVLRTETERPEAVNAGCVKVVGIDEDVIYENAFKLLNNPEFYQSFLKNDNPYGDGNASHKILDAIAAADWKG